MDVVISARIPEDDYQILKKHHVNISQSIRLALARQAQEEKYQESMTILREMRPAMKKIGREEFIKTVRQNRTER